MSFGSTNTFGTLSSAPDGGITEHIFNYVYDILLGFKAHPDENENAITNRFCIILNARKPVEYSYFFHHQNIESEKENTSTDFAVFQTLAYSGNESNMDSETDNNALVKFEAKRLTTKMPKKREREYVIGDYNHGKQVHNSGGIERFKNERHGKDVNVAGIIGYVQTGSFSYWLEKINVWIQDEILNPNDINLKWDDKDKLIEIKSGARISAYKSMSLRKSGNYINLRHLWVNFVCN